jgi:hypothetical protein
VTSTDILSYFEGQISAKEFSDRISDDVLTYSKGLSKKGSSIPLNFNDDRDILIKSEDLGKILGDILTLNFTPLELAFVCDCFTLSDRVEYFDEDVEELVYGFADPEINGGIKTVNEIKDILTTKIQKG